MLKNIDFNKNRQRWKNYFCLFISFLFLIFFYVNRTTILENDPEFSSKFKIASIVLGWIVGVVLIFVRLDFGKKWNRVINILYILFAPCYIFFNMEIAVFNETYSFRGQHLSLLLFNFLLIGILELIFIVITNRVRLGTDIWAFICVMFNIVNHFVYEFRGTPAMASDIATVGTALEVADGYKIQFNFYTTVALVMLFDFIMLGRVIKCEPVFKKVSHRLCGIAVMAIVSVTGFSQLVMTDMVSNRGLYLSLFNPMRSYQQYGSIACFTRSIKLSVPEKPNGYSLKKVEEITSKYTSDTVDPNKKRPNVIAVINEAFSDPQILGEFLTGNSMAFLPKGTVAFQLYLRHAMPSLVTELKSEGYTGNSATHLQKARNYNRDKAYPLLGFDKFYDYTNMGVPFVKMRNNATDQCTYDNITHDYEQQRKSTDAPYFGYTMTIQNHSSYDVPFDNFDDKRIVVENADAPDLGYYLSLIKYSDEMFENLINYYKNTDEPTVILLTGDHQPRIHDESMDSITNGEWRNWNDEEMMRRYEVPFLIWANYDIDKKTVEKTSMNYLQTILMETIDGELTGFQKFQQDLQKEIPVLTSNGYWGADGKFYSVDDKNSPYYDLIQEYAMLQYNDMTDYKNRVEDFFELKQ